MWKLGSFVRRTMYAGVVAGIVITGCATAPVAPTTYRETLYAAELNFAAILSTVTRLDQQNVLTEEGEAKIEAMIDDAKMALDLAELGLVMPRPEDNIEYLYLAQNLLWELNKILRDVEVQQ